MGLFFLFKYIIWNIIWNIKIFCVLDVNSIIIVILDSSVQFFSFGWLVEDSLDIIYGVLVCFLEGV